MTIYRASSCRSCGAEIIWAVTEHGKRMPVDFDLVENGNIELRAGKAHYVEPDGSKRWVSHFATCPEAAQHRQRW